ncbi:MAG TPA: zf-HC2 domain-containing protein [Alloacidobacterium sp.]|nr:zf-HC2 domain-containing protein [Alloacidobacterium sp.]
MDHTEAVNQYAVEKYLLGELSPEVRDAFEEHYFGCEECAADLRAAAVFIAQAKKELARPDIISMPAPATKEKGKLFHFPAILRPAFAVPAMAAMLAIIAFQNVVTVPHLRQEASIASQPQILPSVNLVDGGSRGAEIRTVAATAHQPFLLFVDVPTESRFTGYLCALYSPSGKMVWQITVTPSQAINTLPIQVPADNAEAGVNTLVVQGISSEAPVELVKYRFLLQIR